MTWILIAVLALGWVLALAVIVVMSRQYKTLQYETDMAEERISELATDLRLSQSREEGLRAQVADMVARAENAESNLTFVLEQS